MNKALNKRFKEAQDLLKKRGLTGVYVKRERGKYLCIYSKTTGGLMMRDIPPKIIHWIKEL